MEYTTLFHFISRFTHLHVPICLIIYSTIYASVSKKTLPNLQARAYSLDIRELITGRQSHLDLSKGWMRSVLPSGVLTWAMLLRMTGVP